MKTEPDRDRYPAPPSGAPAPLGRMTCPSRTEQHGCGEDLDDVGRGAGRALTLWVSGLWANTSHEFTEPRQNLREHPQYLQ
jgi:hypothetical protein